MAAFLIQDIPWAGGGETEVLAVYPETQQNGAITADVDTYPLVGKAKFWVTTKLDTYPLVG